MRIAECGIGHASIPHSAIRIPQSPGGEAMSQANWSEYIRSRPVASEESQSGPPLRSMRWLLDWESWLTLGLVMIVFLSVARSIDAANWVPQMPSLVGVSFLAILTGFFLAKVNAPQGVLHLAALAIGFLVILLLMLGFI